jgi:hypothetical protein
LSRRKQPDKLAKHINFALPRPERIDGKLWDDLLGMTSRQSQMAFDLSFRDRERSRLTRAALARYIEALRDFEPALEDYREEPLKNFDAYCPRAAKRIREGKPPRRRSRRLTKA